MANGAVGVAVNTKSQWHNQVEQSAHAGLMGKLKGIVITPTQSTQKATNAALTFEAYFKDAVGRAGSGVPEHSRAGFQARAQELFREILDNSFDPVVRDGLTRGDGRVSDKLVREAVAQANQKAQQALVELQTYALYARQADGGGAQRAEEDPSGADGATRHAHDGHQEGREEGGGDQQRRQMPHDEGVHPQPLSFLMFRESTVPYFL